MHLFNQLRYASVANSTRRTFLGQGLAGFGSLWLGSKLAAASLDKLGPIGSAPLAARPTHFAPKVNRIIYLHMCGGPSQLELFEHKPELNKYDGKDCPQELLQGNRFAFIRGVPKLMAGLYPFHRAGQTGAWISDQLPCFERVIDKVCFIRTMQTEQFNHAPAQLLAHTGNQNLGYASMGSWVTYGLGSENQNLPGFVVLLSGGKFPDAGKSVWNSGFLPSVYQGVQCRSHGDPVLYLSNPEGIDRPLRERIIQAINGVNEQAYAEFGDPETVARISQFELAFRMQMSATEAMDFSRESASVQAEYGVAPGRESFANNCLIARRLVERGVRFVQLYDWGWDSHGAGEYEALNYGFRKKCREIDRPIAALLIDLEQRGLLDDTLVVWASEFGRTPMRENRGGQEIVKLKGRDHHPHAFTAWLAGAGVKPGFSYGETDSIGFHALSEVVLPRDFQATLLHLMGIDHKRLVFPYQGLDQKLTGVQPARIIDKILS